MAGHSIGVEAESQCTAWVHQVQRDDGCTLFGFQEKRERDLFRTLISVNGVGPQMALALLDSCSADELVMAIVDGDLRRLSQAQGVGKRTAERLAVELRDRLSGWHAPADDAVSLVDRTDLKTLPIQGDARLVAEQNESASRTEMTLGRFLECCEICYDANAYERLAPGMSPLEKYRRMADGRDDGLLTLEQHRQATAGGGDDPAPEGVDFEY